MPQSDMRGAKRSVPASDLLRPVRPLYRWRALRQGERREDAGKGLCDARERKEIKSDEVTL